VSGTSGRVAVFNGSTSVGDDAQFTWDTSSNKLTLGSYGGGANGALVVNGRTVGQSQSGISLTAATEVDPGDITFLELTPSGSGALGSLKHDLASSEDSRVLYVLNSGSIALPVKDQWSSATLAAYKIDCGGSDGSIPAKGVSVFNYSTVDSRWHMALSSNASGSVTSVNLTAPAAGITVSGGPITGSGSITLALADDLGAVEAITGTGMVSRTASTPTYATRTITAGTGISVSNGDGVSGNPTITATGAPTSLWTYSTQNASFNAAKDNIYAVTANSVVATLPASPTAGDRIRFIIESGVTGFSLGRNGNKIMNLAEDMTVTATSRQMEIIYDTNDGWMLI
jgi:hypothetical protein